jgi:hypothetical protein
VSDKSEKRPKLSSASRHSESMAQLRPLEGNDTVLAIREVTEEVGICHCSCPAILANDLEMRHSGPDLRGTELGGLTGASTKHK